MRLLIFALLFAACEISPPEPLHNTETCRSFDIEDRGDRWRITIHSDAPMVELCTEYGWGANPVRCSMVQAVYYDCITIHKPSSGGLRFVIDGCASEWYY